MGIEKFNKFIESYEGVYRTKYDYIIIDGDNLLWIVIQGTLSKFRKNYKSVWDNGINIELLHQINSIVNESVNSIMIRVNQYAMKYKCDKIVIVFDPDNTPDYQINVDKIDSEFISIFQQDIKNGKLIYNLKSEEQTRRINSKLYSDDKYLKDIDNSTIVSKEYVKNIYKQCTFFINNVRLLFHPILFKFIQRTNHTFVFSKDEADLVIKNYIYNVNESDKHFLVISTDTDYYILFGDTPNVDVTAFYKMNHGEISDSLIYNPYNIFKTFFDKYYNFEYVIRLAPLFGNDYTTTKAKGSSYFKNRILTTDKPNEILSLFNIDNTFNNLSSSHRASKIRKFYECVKDIFSGESPISIKALDNLIMRYDKEYFNKYYLSTTIYSNWREYGHYNIAHETAHDIEMKLDEAFGVLFERIYEEFDGHLIMNINVNIHERIDDESLQEFECSEEMYLKMIENEYDSDEDVFLN